MHYPAFALFLDSVFSSENLFTVVNLSKSSVNRCIAYGFVTCKIAVLLSYKLAKEGISFGIATATGSYLLGR